MKNKLLAVVFIVALFSTIVMMYLSTKITPQLAIKSLPELSLNTKFEGSNIHISQIPSKISSNERMTISWTYDTKLKTYGDEVVFCLIAKQKANNTIIDTVAKTADLCFYTLGASNYGLEIGKAQIANESTTLILPSDLSAKFESTPDFYVVKMLMVDQRTQDGLTEWAGTVGYATAEPIYVTTSK